MENPLSRFKLSRFSFHLQALETLSLPSYKGSTLRGAFGHTFKKVVCVNRQRICAECILKGKCIYSYVFETPPPSDTSMMRKYPYAPHPFVILPPLDKKTLYEKGDSLIFQLTLIGKAIDFLPYFVYTFDELGKNGLGKGKGKCELVEVRLDRFEGLGPTLIYSGKDKILQNQVHVITGKDFESQDVGGSILELLFLTPTRLKYDGHLTSKPEFHILLRNLLRRVSLLSYFHCNFELNVDFKGLIEAAKKVRVSRADISWLDWERYSQRQETRMKMGGFLGSISFEGELERFLLFIRLGELIHVGKGTSFGLGKYTIVGGKD